MFGQLRVAAQPHILPAVACCSHLTDRIVMPDETKTAAGQGMLQQGNSTRLVGSTKWTHQGQLERYLGAQGRRITADRPASTEPRDG